MKVTLVGAARPNWPKIMPIWRELVLRAHKARIIHAGQHSRGTALDVYDELGLPPPDVELARFAPEYEMHAEQTARIMVGVERDLFECRPDWLVVVGDVDSTLAAALAASKLGVKIAHVEAGLRSGDWSMPEEINRVLVDEMADLWLAPDETAWRRGIRPREPCRRVGNVRTRNVGNVMVDSLHWALAQEPKAWMVVAPDATKDRVQWGSSPDPYAVVTMHRPSNVDRSEDWAKCVAAVDALQARGLGIVWPHHPRTQRDPRMIEPLSYTATIHALSHAKLVLTDSGGVQEETTVLGVPCFTFRENTERPITVEEGTNTVVGTDPGRVAKYVDALFAGMYKHGIVPHLWDGKAAGRIVDALEER